MAFDEEEPRSRAAPTVARDLRTLSVADLEAYAVDLEAEAARVRSEIAQRRDVRGAADAFFRKPAGAADS
jgi:uncharacterized small protein (DUF1192 family)